MVGFWDNIGGAGGLARTVGIAAEGVGDEQYWQKQRLYTDQKNKEQLNQLLNLAANAEPGSEEYNVVVQEILKSPVLPPAFRDRISQVHSQGGRPAGVTSAGNGQVIQPASNFMAPQAGSTPTPVGAMTAAPNTSAPNIPTTKPSVFDFLDPSKSYKPDVLAAIDKALKTDPNAPAQSSWDAALAAGQNGVGFVPPVTEQFPDGVRLPADVRREGGTVVERPGVVLPADANRNGGTATVGPGTGSNAGATGGAPSGTKYPGYGPAGQPGGIVGPFPAQNQPGGIIGTGDPSVDEFLQTVEGQEMLKNSGQYMYMTDRDKEAWRRNYAREKLSGMLNAQAGGDTGAGKGTGGAVVTTGGAGTGVGSGVWGYQSPWNFGIANSQKKALTELALAKANLATAKTPYEVALLQERIDRLVAQQESDKALANQRQAAADQTTALTQPKVGLTEAKTDTEGSKKANYDAMAGKNDALGWKATSDAEANQMRAEADVTLKQSQAALADARRESITTTDPLKKKALEARTRQIETAIKVSEAKLNADDGTVKKITQIERAVKSTLENMENVRSTSPEYKTLEKAYSDLMGQLDKVVGGVKELSTTTGGGNTSQDFFGGYEPAPVQVPTPAQSKPLDDATAKQIFDSVGGDAEKARQKAREMGYSF